MGVDDVQVVAGPHNPAKARLPAQYAAAGVELDVVDERDERRESRFADHTVEVGRDTSVGKVHLDRYAARYVNFVLVGRRTAVLGARSAPKRHWQPAEGSAGISRAEPLVGCVSLV